MIKKLFSQTLDWLLNKRTELSLERKYGDRFDAAEERVRSEQIFERTGVNNRAVVVAQKLSDVTGLAISPRAIDRHMYRFDIPVENGELVHSISSGIVKEIESGDKGALENTSAFILDGLDKHRKATAQS